MAPDQRQPQRPGELTTPFQTGKAAAIARWPPFFVAGKVVAIVSGDHLKLK